MGATDRIGRWKLAEELGSGGNAVVSRGITADGDSAAIKILKSKKRGEPYERFRREVEIQRRLTEAGERGILPIIDAYIPVEPSKTERAWLATPIAETIQVALGETPAVGCVLDAIGAIAGTLARLAARGMSHRDIKPDNLYRYDGRWVIGDFGLVALPDVTPLTVGGKGLGPRHFMAYEMIASPESADGRPADVYSLAKTLWVLLTGQKFPPPGQQSMANNGTRVASYIQDDRSTYIDKLIERSTSFDPSQRPTMAEFYDELAALTRVAVPPASHKLDLANFAKELNLAMEPGQREIDRRSIRQSQMRESELKLRDYVGQIRNSMDKSKIPYLSMGPNRSACSCSVGKWNLINEEFSEGYAIILGQEIPATSRTLAGRARSIHILAGIGIRTTSDGKAFVGAAYALGDGSSGYRQPFWQMDKNAALGSAQLELAISQIGTRFIEELPNTIEVLIKGLRTLHQA